MGKWICRLGAMLCVVISVAAVSWPASEVQDSATVLPIGLIQGDGTRSPFLDQEVTLRGVVTGFYEDRNAAGIIYHTAFVQDLPGHEDGNEETSDGIALFLGKKGPFFQVGNLVRVTGRVTEFYGLTELDDAGLEIVIEEQSVALPPLQPLVLPDADADLVDHFERWEGMLVAWPKPALVVGPTHRGCGLAVVGIDADAAADAVALAAALAERPLPRKAAAANHHVLPVLHNSDVDCSGFPDARVGDTLIGLAGPLTYSFDRYRLVQMEPDAIAITAAPLPELPEPLQPTTTEFTVATVNLENYFDAVRDTGHTAEPLPTEEEIAVKRTKLAHALGHTLGCPTLAGVQEVEKATLLQELAAEVAGICGFTYTVTHRESVDQRGIDVALLSDPRRVTIESADLRQGCTSIATGVVDVAAGCAPGEHPLFSRPPLQVTVGVDGHAHILFVNHFKSKRGGETETAPRRLAQAEHQLALVRELLGRDAAARIVVMGDFNDFEQSPPLQTLALQLTNALADVPPASRYSFVYEGNAQLLDALLLSPAARDAVRGVQIIHANADFPAAWGSDVSPERLAYRATDHDLPLLLLALPPEDMAVPQPDPPLLPAATALPVQVPEPQFQWAGQVVLALLGTAALIIALAVLVIWRRRRQSP